jgi:hypothetical protein
MNYKAKFFGGAFLNNEVGNFSVGAMQLRNYLCPKGKGAGNYTW